uniref:Uncharacterized protein n=1 Tax=Chromulina nebulosa TaxID=96789 RepID=A0A7S0SSN4_9STRA|mmetsp:Transcript_2999/g.2656  ORF Transcript_2999/g.2656 Transcript_2999/m.2656 type:complete len:181 (+) Transcript_2999:91-633(+)
MKLQVITPNLSEENCSFDESNSPTYNYSKRGENNKVSSMVHRIASVFTFKNNKNNTIFAESNYHITDINVLIGLQPNGSRGYFLEQLQASGCKVKGQIERCPGKELKIKIQGSLEDILFIENNIFNNKGNYWKWCKMNSITIKGNLNDVQLNPTKLNPTKKICKAPIMSNYFDESYISSS